MDAREFIPGRMSRNIDRTKIFKDITITGGRLNVYRSLQY